jgi:transposase
MLPERSFGKVRRRARRSAISAFLAAADRHYVRVGLEAGPLCQWLYAGLTKAGFPVICIETRHAQAVLSARPNKTPRRHLTYV